MFLQVSVCPQGGAWSQDGEGVCSRGCLLPGGVPGPGVCLVQGSWYPRMHCPQGEPDLRVSAPGGVCSQGCAWSREVCLVWGRVGIPRCTEADPPGEMATAADGTHTTGMHSCCLDALSSLNKVTSYSQQPISAK